MLKLLLKVLPALVLLWAILAVFLFVFPHQDHPKHASAIIVLGGDSAQRVPKGLRLAEDGVAPVLVISDGAEADWAPARALCAHPGGHRFKIICFRPHPFNTQGEARNLAKMAEARGWRSLLVVTSDFHVYRARMLIRRCLKRNVRLYMEDTRSSWLWMAKNAAAETVKITVMKTFRRGC